MEEKLISVIVPVYKVEKYLDQCVESIVNQTYRNLEILLVDDGSPDRCPELCDRWAEKDDRIRVIHKQNGGLSDARNAGLHAACGELVMFVDSDDWLALDMAEKMSAAMEQCDADMAICQYNKAYPSGKMKCNFEGAEPRRCCDQTEMYRLLLEDREISNHVWRRLYRKKLLPEEPFPKGRNYEDLYVMAELSSRCRAFVILGDALYFYRDNAEGIMKDKSFKNVNDYLDALEKNEEDIRRLCPETPEREIVESRVRTTTYAWEDTMLSQKMTADEKKQICERIKKWANIPIQETKGVYWRRRVYYALIYQKRDRAALAWYRLWIDPNSVWCHMRRGLKKAAFAVVGKHYEEPAV